MMYVPIDSMPWEMTRTVEPPSKRKKMNSPIVANIPRFAR